MKTRHIFIAIFIAFIWGFNFVMVKSGLEEIPPFLYVCVRYVCAAIPLAFFIKKPEAPTWIILAIGLSLGVCKFALMFLGIYLGVSAGIASLVLQTQAFFTILLAFLFFKVRVSLQQIIGMLIAFLGIFFIGIEMHGAASLSGFLLLIGAAFAWAISNVITKKAGNADMFALVVWTSMIPPLPMLALSWTFEGGTNTLIETWTQLTWNGVFCTLYMAWVATLIGATLWAKLISVYSPSQVAPFSLLIPVFAITSASIFLGETMSIFVMFACSLVFIGLVINQWPRKIRPTLSSKIIEKAIA
jgi:O-acetylserine/cysteine efflux transporter